MESELDAYRKAVEGLYRVTARFKRVHTVRGRLLGVVFEFQIDHPEASAAYAWSDPVPGSDHHRFYAVLKQGPVDSPEKAVRAAIVSEYRESTVGGSDA